MYNYPYGDNQQINLNWIISEIIALHQRLDPDYTAPTFTQIYPFSDTQQLNLDWILTELKALKDLAPTPPPTELIDEIGQALIAGAYDADTSYQKNDYIVQDGKLYRANAATTGTFDPTKWNEILLGDDLAIITRWADATNSYLNSLAASNIANDSSVTGTTVKDALNNLNGAVSDLNGAIKTKLDIAPTYTGATDLDSIVTYALSIGILGKPFAFIASYTSGNTGFFATSSFTVICCFSSANYGYGIMFSDHMNSVAMFRRSSGTNFLIPLSHISQITENEQTSLTANRSYSIGDCFSYNGDLYRVTTSILNGGTITIGTNAVKTTLDEAIKINYASEGMPFTAATNVDTTHASFEQIGNMITPVGYFATSAAIAAGKQLGSVSKTVRKRQLFNCIDINTHLSYAIYFNTDGTITTVEGMPQGYFRFTSPIII